MGVAGFPHHFEGGAVEGGVAAGGVDFGGGDGSVGADGDGEGDFAFPSVPAGFFGVVFAEVGLDVGGEFGWILAGGGTGGFFGLVGGGKGFRWREGDFGEVGVDFGMVGGECGGCPFHRVVELGECGVEVGWGEVEGCIGCNEVGGLFGCGDGGACGEVGGGGFGGALGFALGDNHLDGVGNEVGWGRRYGFEREGGGVDGGGDEEVEDQRGHEEPKVLGGPSECRGHGVHLVGLFNLVGDAVDAALAEL